MENEDEEWTTTLGACVDRKAAASKSDDEADKYKKVHVIVNPHGRYVSRIPITPRACSRPSHDANTITSDALKRGLNGHCPECNTLGWVCPGCMGGRWPEIRGGCAVDQSCPQCMGFEFACDDNVNLRIIDDIETRIRLAKGAWASSEEDIKAMEKELLEETIDRYEWINRRRAEMGRALINVKDLEREYRELYEEEEEEEQ